MLEAAEYTPHAFRAHGMTAQAINANRIARTTTNQPTMARAATGGRRGLGCGHDSHELTARVLHGLLGLVGHLLGGLELLEKLLDCVFGRSLDWHGTLAPLGTHPP